MLAYIELNDIFVTYLIGQFRIMEYTEEELDAIFSKAIPILGMTRFRKDRHGNIILRSAYGQANDPFGWEIDCMSLGTGNDGNVLDNLQPLHIASEKI